MRWPRLRFTLQWLMFLVAVVSLAIWVMSDAVVKTPARQHAKKLIQHHEVRAGVWNFMADSSPQDAERFAECQRLVAWHLQRVRDLKNGGVPVDRRWWEEGDQTTRYEQGLFNRMGGTGMAPVSYIAL
jgi:hypothetical protein